MKYILLLTHDGSRSCYGPFTMNQAILAKTKIIANVSEYNQHTIEIVYLTEVKQ